MHLGSELILKNGTLMFNKNPSTFTTVIICSKRQVTENSNMTLTAIKMYTSGLIGE